MSPRILRATRRAAAAALLVALATSATGQEVSNNRVSRPAEDVARAVHLLSRATWGVRGTDLDAALTAGLETWLERQLHPARIDDRAMAARLAAFPTVHLSMAELYRDFSPQRVDAAPAPAAPAQPGTAAADAPRQAMSPADRRARQARSPARLLNDLVGAKIQRAVHSERQLQEVMTDFWFNHFNVFFGKGQTRFLVADYERTAIRPHVFGRFEDMLLATAQHPAMLFYLDNWQSVHVEGQAAAPGAPPLVQRQRARGLNENYARELLELHTLGVDGGYTQQDVVEIARAFTGWSFQPYTAARTGAAPGAARNGRQAQRRGGRDAIVGPGEVPFVFRPQMHDRGAKTVLGSPLPAGRGIEDGRDVIRLLAQHPSTARHVATKLVERFVSDAPPPDLVDRVADVFLATGGDLRAVTRALFTAEGFFRTEHRDSKVKTPVELVVSSVRAAGADVQPSRRLVAVLRGMGHLPYSEPAPTGFPAASEDWVNAGAMLNRIDFALDLASGRIDGVRPAAGAIAAPAPSVRSGVESLLAAVLPGRETGRLADRIHEDLEQEAGLPPPARAARVLALALGSPEFQRR